MTTWYLWEVIPEKTLAKLMMYQWNNYGEKLILSSSLRPAVTLDSQLESVEGIGSIIRKKPKPVRVK